MKTMLITGTSRGVGKACVEEFSRDWNLITVSRTGPATYTGDLKDPRFRRKILDEVCPDAFINNAGIAGSDSDWTSVNEVNYIAAGELMVGFYRKMKSGHIVNLASVVSNHCGYAGMTMQEITYFSSKASLKRLAVILDQACRSPVKITSLEPGMIMTDMGEIRTRYENAERYPDDYITRNKIQPMDPGYVARTIRWILEQPENVVIRTLEIANRREARPFRNSS